MEAKMNEATKPLNVEEAASYLHITRAYLYNLVHYRKITAYKPGGKMLLFKLQDLENYAFRNQKGDSTKLSEQADSILQRIQSRRKKK
jgi:excisionase family DNA binding protein